MNIKNLVEKLNTYKPGTFISVSWEKDISSAKAKKQGTEVRKKCKGVVRLGINYNNIKSIIDSLPTFDDKEFKKESWFTHCEDNRCLVKSKKDEEKKYLQIFTVPGCKIKSSIEVNGEKQSADNLYEQGLITKSSLPNSEQLVTMTLSIDNIVKIG